MLTHGSLFSGIGAFDLAFERVGIQTKWQVEIDDYATKVLKKRFPKAKRFRDIREVGLHNLGPVDVISGGFPCTDISPAGRKAGIRGKESGLFFEMLRVIKEIRPRVVCAEISADLLSRGLDEVLKGLAALGYDAWWSVLPACAFGAPHMRKRVLLVADTHGEIVRYMRWVKSTEGLRKSWHRHFQETPKPGVFRVDDGVPNRMDRHRCLGNSIVVPVAEHVAAWAVLLADDGYRALLPQGRKSKL